MSGAGVAAVGAMLLVLAGCGGRSPTASAKGAAVAYYTSLGTGNVRSACRRLAPAVVRGIASAAIQHSDAGDLATDSVAAA